MSRILRRPMFRGGRVSSYGTGIASGLADGGRVNLDVGGRPDWAQNTQWSRQNWDPRVSPVKTGSDLLKEAYTPRNTWLPAWIQGNIEAQSPSKARGWDLSKPIVEETDFEEINKDQLSFPRDVEEMGVETEVKSNIDTSSVDGLDGKVLENQNSDDAELSLEEIKEALGGDKARARDLTDMAMSVGSRWLEEGATVKSGLSKFLGDEAKKGPSRTEVIDKEAATFMLKDKFQTKRDKAKINLMMADTDYKLKAGKVISVQEGVLLATKGSNFSDKKLGAGIQNATSDVTGEKYKYKGTTTKEGLKAALNSGELKAGDTVIVKETIKVKGQPDKTIKKIIEIQLIDGKLQVEEIYQV